GRELRRGDAAGTQGPGQGLALRRRSQGRAMRHPVSTLATSRGEERLRGAMSADVVGGVILPAAPEDAGPRAGQDADRVLMAAAAGARPLIHEGGPARGVPRVIGEGGEGAAQALVAGPAEDDGVV